MSTLHVGFIGAGNRTLDIIKGILAAGDIEIVAVADPCEQSVNNFLSRLPYKPAVFNDYKQMLNGTKLDAVILATPNDTHKPIAFDVISAGIPLYLEKPMAITVEDCNSIAEYAKEKNVPLMIGMQLRYSDVYIQMKQLCDDGIIGDIKLLFFRALRSQFRAGVDGWRLKKARSGGMILEVSVHQLDLFNWFAGSSFKKIAAFGGKDVVYKGQELLDNAIMMVEYENGVRANLQAAVFTPQGGDNIGLMVVGEKGTMYHTNSEIIVRLADGSKILTYPTTGYAKMEENVMKGLREFVLFGNPPLTSATAGCEAVELAVEAERAIESNIIVER